MLFHVKAYDGGTADFCTIPPVALARPNLRPLFWVRARAAVPPLPSCRATLRDTQLVLTSKGFPSYFFIAISQFTSTCLVVNVLRLTGHVQVCAKAVCG